MATIDTDGEAIALIEELVILLRDVLTTLRDINERAQEVVTALSAIADNAPAGSPPDMALRAAQSADLATDEAGELLFLARVRCQDTIEPPS